MKKNEIHYMDHVMLITDAKTENKEFIEIYPHGIVHMGVTGRVKEVHGNNVTVDLPFGFSDVRVFVTKDDLKVIE